MKVTVEIEDSDFIVLQNQGKEITGTDGTKLRYVWCDTAGIGKRKILEIHRKRNGVWSFVTGLRAGETSNPIHGVTFVNSGKN
jgi:hypothetical protein